MQLIAIAALVVQMTNGISIERVTVADGATFAIQSPDPKPLNVRAVFVIDENGTPVWGALADEEDRPDPFPERIGMQLLGGTHYLLDRSGDCSAPGLKLPVQVEEWLRLAPQIGRPITVVTYGEVPEGFVQVVPESGKPTGLRRGVTYRMFVLGRSSGAISFVW